MSKKVKVNWFNAKLVNKECALNVDNSIMEIVVLAIIKIAFKDGNRQDRRQLPAIALIVKLI